MQSKLKIKAFTLVELIVVITILAILGTIAFISLQGYSANARDSVRISNLTNMSKGLALIVVKDGTLPEPEGSIANITVSGSTIMTQGELTQTIAEQRLKMSGDITDPVDQTNPIYSLSSNKKSYQIAMFLEQGGLTAASRDSRSAVSIEFITNTYAANGKTLITKGDKLGIVLSPTEERVNTPGVTTPVSIELDQTTTEYKIYLDDEETIEGSGSLLTSINPTMSCKRILETGGARSANGGDGVYTINPEGTDFSVYCDMTTDGGGWTQLLNISENSNEFYFGSAHWNTVSTLNPEVFSHSISSKYNTYNTMVGDYFLIKIGDISFKLDADSQSALTKITGEYIDKQWDTGYSSCDARELSSSHGYVDNMQLQGKQIWKGINLGATTSNSARFGWIGDNTQPDNIMGATSDSAFGLGIKANGRQLSSGRLTWPNSGCFIDNYGATTTGFTGQLFIR